ncbi:hypothetical protein [Actinomadura kijaniata]|uniref:hypothetical protein n=1 Tax=Actinomadura kijaniata TaxID=46161 RepID=UPI00082CC292|nr:hypothetical protein [Actinomadura kijaniata]
MSELNVLWTRSPNGHVVPVAPGVGFAPGPGASLTERARAISGLLPEGCAVARRTAAWIWGLDVLPPGVSAMECDVDLVLAPGPMPPGRDPRWTELPDDHVVERDGVRVTTLARTALDCVRWLPRRDAVAALDQFLRRGVSEKELRAMARILTGYRNNTRLSALLGLGDGGAQSPGESWVRLITMDAGFPRPRTQIPIPGPNDELLYVDLGYPDYQVGLEYDGEEHHTGRRARAHDAARRRWLKKERGWNVIPVTKDFLPRPGPYLEALLTTLLQRGWEPGDDTMDRIATRLARLNRRRR